MHSETYASEVEYQNPQINVSRVYCWNYHPTTQNKSEQEMMLSSKLVVKAVAEFNSISCSALKRSGQLLSIS
jgi:hypothetical protein